MGCDLEFSIHFWSHVTMAKLLNDFYLFSWLDRICRFSWLILFLTLEIFFERCWKMATSAWDLHGKPWISNTLQTKCHKMLKFGDDFSFFNANMCGYQWNFKDVQCDRWTTISQLTWNLKLNTSALQHYKSPSNSDSNGNEINESAKNNWCDHDSDQLCTFDKLEDLLDFY